MISVEVKALMVLRALTGYARQVGPEGRRVANSKLSVQLSGWVLRNFRSEGKLAQAGGWAPLAPSTIQGRARRIRGKGKRAKVRKLYRQGATRNQVAQAGGGKLFGRFPILQDTGALRSSFLPFYDAEEAGVGAVSYINFKRGSKAPTDIARVHQLGDRGRKIPARPMLPTKRQGLDMAVRVYQQHLRQMLQKGSQP